MKNHGVNYVSSGKLSDLIFFLQMFTKKIFKIFFIKIKPLQNCIGPTIRIGQESWCLLYAGFFL